jgi:hypothetical protein
MAVLREATMKHWVAIVVLLTTAGTGLALTPDPASQPQQQIIVQFSVGTGTTLVGFKVARRAVPVGDELVSAPGRFCLRLPFDCALVVEGASADESRVVVRPQVGSIAFEVAVDRVRPSGS